MHEVRDVRDSYAKVVPLGNAPTRAGIESRELKQDMHRVVVNTDALGTDA